MFARNPALEAVVERAQQVLRTSVFAELFADDERKLPVPTGA